MQTLRKLWAAINRHMTLLRLLFVLSVLLYVIHEVGRDLQQISGEQVSEIFSQQSPLTLLAMLVVGFIAVTPMLNYDFNVVKFLPGTFKKGYIVRSGWTVNTFTNIAGFGGLLGASLRANFYSKGATRKEILFAISKIALFLLTGLSLVCWIALAQIFIFHTGTEFTRYWIWLVGGALYFPGVMLATHFTDSEFFNDLTWRRQFSLMISSSLEWLGCSLFFIFIGVLMGIKVDFAAVLPMFAVASVAGVVSLIPGGLGSFDTFMLTGLGFIGVDKADALVWLLLYRIFYYILPFLVGVLFFIQDMGSKLNQSFEGLPMQLFRRVAHIFLTTFLWFSGVMIILVSTFPHLQEYNKVYGAFYGYVVYFANQATNIIMGFLLIGLARGVNSRVKRAFWPTTIVLIMATLNTLWKDPSIKISIFLMLVLAALWLSHKEFYREHFEYSWGAMLFDGISFVGIFVTYIIVGVYNTPNYQRVHHVPRAALFPTERVWFSGLMAIMIAVLILAAVYWYMHNGKSSIFKTPFDAQRVEHVIGNYGGNEVSHLAYLRDKLLYFYQVDGEDKMFFMYQKKADRLIVMGEPVGDPQYREAAIDDFMDVADKEGYSIVFYEIDENLTLSLHEKGYDFLKFGEEGFVHLPSFSMDGKKRKSDRNLMSKFDRDGITFAELQPPFRDDTLQELRHVSDEWLDGQNESGFSLGFFDDYYLDQASIYVMRNAEGRIVAFTTNMPTHTDVSSIDLMRYGKDAPSGTMDVMFIHLLQHNAEVGSENFNMGMAPLSNVGVSRFSFIEERLAHLIYEYGYRFYGFQGLRNYKEKYVNSWHPKYIAYRRRSSLVFTMMQITLVVNTKRRTDGKNKNIFVFRRNR
ncbi:bifunctional lysylphosphatidylglycerol flippase/synthetase MprF [Furfurilactobacillus siliginis]|uniref:Lysyl-tRNA synthetase (Class II) n=1 Tax=Furfurilactobacillus siliginis TaxID=348151 RepID=A0A0R2L4S3_9LACO|nr:bifunctional lysylphosphatidylglycerol flippase/synthetase MprF [Furfurilactobacillus siliginis]KRN94250.1 Lysyl-tRNA synthetase (class II) [Furfurilactobacillus siliginis]GEK29375.1 phosphatidylglycerol lysyltransferase [Furfurilactobacillus siliginis]